jgi:type I restriction enzyme M protein
MLDQTTKRKLDSARQILVGKVPDPKAQVEQITTALIYKFMDDMDKENEEVGLKTQFFVDDWKKFSWTKILDNKLSGQERLDLYVQAITNMPKNPHIPQLFRNIFKGAFLPYNDARTLSLFLKEINEFNYEHSENLGNAFEYLLSILGSQGDAGQFRTPRHIIDFIVDVVDPKKNETILDPACGTAGFLISAYKHILKQNKEKALTPDEKLKLMNNLAGYDISPDMVKLALVNMYLHGFPEPKIHEYDTLSSEKRWGETFDVIMANPPFMTPKGGIVPHKRFSIQANRAEVLFVDYIVEHLTIKGRAGIIVPEGVIFQSNNAYTQLRKKLVEDGLFAVVSLPAGVFNPYAGVKTSILLFDNEISKKTKNFLFLKIQNDGFDLGAQRREHSKNDLPLASEIIKKYKSALNDNEAFEFSESEKQIAHLVSKEKIIATGDYNLSGDRYKEVISFANLKWEMVKLGVVCNIYNGSTPLRSEKSYWEKGTIPWFTIDDIRNQGRIIKQTAQKITQNALDKTSVKLLPKKTILLCCTASVGEYAITEIETTTNQQFNGLVVKEEYKEMLLPEFLFNLSKTFKDELIRLSGKTSFNFIPVGTLRKIKIPLPPIEVQKEIVEQIEVKQSAIDHAKAIIQNLERERRYFGQSLRKLEGVKIVELGEVAEVIAGQSPEGKYYNETGEGMPFYQGKTEFSELYIGKPKVWTTKITKIAERDDILMSVRAPVGPVNIATEKVCIGRGLASIRANKVDQMFLFNFLKSIDDKIKGNSGAVFDSINKKQIEELKIPLPSLEIQKKLVAEAEKEQQIINANKQLIEIYEQKINDVLSEI